VEGINWGMNTDYNKAMLEILRDAVKNKVPKEDMPTHILVLSDMQFDSSGGNSTNHTSAKEAFKAAGYDLPNIVYWNLAAGYGTFPTMKSENGVALVSGFSPSALKAVVACDPEKLSPILVMNEAIAPFLKWLE
jgi:hypothetical protein